MANPFVHVELNTTDLDQAKHFYQQLFDWQLQEMPMPGGAYVLIQVGEGTGGGMMTHPIPGAPSAWLPYVLVDDIELAAQKARVLGATVLKEITPVPDMGWFCILCDPTGAVIGLWQSQQ